MTEFFLLTDIFDTLGLLSMQSIFYAVILRESVRSQTSETILYISEKKAAQIVVELLRGSSCSLLNKDKFSNR